MRDERENGLKKKKSPTPSRKYSTAGLENRLNGKSLQFKCLLPEVTEFVRSERYARSSPRINI